MLPAALLLAVVLVGQFGGPSLKVANWLTLVPLVAAGLCSPWVTAFFGLLALVTNRTVNAAVTDAHLPAEDFVLEVVSVLLAIFIAVLRTQARDYVHRLQGVAETTRQVLLRPVPPGWAGVDSAARYLAADVEARVGGDFYEVLATPRGARVLLGDVQGKGLPAVSTAGALVGAFREAGYHEPDLSVVATRMEQRLKRHNALMRALGDPQERFATGVIVGFPTEGPDIEVVNFGHEGPLVIGPRGVRRLPQEQGPPLGLADLVGGPPPVCRVVMEQGETVLLVSDGVSEARDRAGRFLPLRPWLERLATDHPDGIAPGELLRLLTDQLFRHAAGRLTDDATLLAVRLPPRGAGSPVTP